MSSLSLWHLDVLGIPRLVSACGQEWRLERKSLALLAYLALEGPAPRARLVAMLWPHTPGPAARNNLVHLLRRLRQLVGQDLITGQAVLTLSPDLQVNAGGLLGEVPDQEPQAGEFLGGLDFDDLPDLADWAAAWQEQLEARRLSALAQAATRSEESGEWAAALQAAGRLLELDPLSEEALRRVMRLHYLAGDRPAALRAYARGRDLLRRELGAVPETQTQALARHIDRGEALPGTPTAPRPLPLAVLRPPTLVGREVAWSQLEAAWAAGKTIYVTGDAGVGKTRLAQDFVASKGRALFLPGHAGAQEVPFAAAAHNARARLAAAPQVTLPGWVQRELSRVLPELRRDDPPAPINSEAARLNYFLAHLEVVRLTGRGCAAVISDDVQYYDPATVELGAFFLTQSFPLGEVDDVPRHLITYRRGSLPPHTAARIDALVQAGMAARIELGPLDQGAVAALLDDLEVPAGSALASELHDLTGGNPQFVLEALRHMYQSGEFRVDAGLRGRGETGMTPLVAQRLAQLSPGALQAARGAAVLRDGFTLEVLAEVLGTGLLDLAAAWEVLEEAQIVSGERFSHDLVREAVLEGVSPAVRTLLHRASARVLSRHAVHPGQVARHWLEAGDLAQAAPWLMQAGEVAQQTRRPAEAEAFYAQAAEAYSALGDEGGERAARTAAQDQRPS